MRHARIQGVALADRDQLERGFSRLSPEQRALVVLHYYLELPMHETAEYPLVCPSAR